MTTDEPAHEPAQAAAGDPTGRPRWSRTALLVAALVGTTAGGVLIGAQFVHPKQADPVSDFSFKASRCHFDAAKGGLVTTVTVTSRDAGRMTMTLEAVPSDYNLDDPKPVHRVDLTVPFEPTDGPATKRLETTIPLSEKDFRGGLTDCRVTVPTPDGY